LKEKERRHLRLHAKNYLRTLEKGSSAEQMKVKRKNEPLIANKSKAR